jgi:hypothetical protein
MLQIDLVRVVVYGLALATLSRWMANESGMFGVAEKIRAWFWVPRHDEIGRPIPPANTLREQIGAMLRCYVCNAPYVLAFCGIVFLLLFRLNPIDAKTIRDFVAIGLAVIQVSYLANKYST